MFDCILYIKYNNVQMLLLLVALYRKLEDSDITHIVLSTFETDELFPPIVTLRVVAIYKYCSKVTNDIRLMPRRPVLGGTNITVILQQLLPSMYINCRRIQNLPM